MLKKTLCLNSCTGKTRIRNIHLAYLTKADEFTKIFYEPKSYKTHNLCIKKEVPSLKKKKMHKLQGNGMTETSKPNQIMAPTWNVWPCPTFHTTENLITLLHGAEIYLPKTSSLASALKTWMRRGVIYPTWPLLQTFEKIILFPPPQHPPLPPLTLPLAPNSVLPSPGFTSKSGFPNPVVFFGT